MTQSTESAVEALRAAWAKFEEKCGEYKPDPDNPDRVVTFAVPPEDMLVDGRVVLASRMCQVPLLYVYVAYDPELTMDVMRELSTEIKRACANWTNGDEEAVVLVVPRASCLTMRGIYYRSPAAGGSFPGPIGVPSRGGLVTGSSRIRGELRVMPLGLTGRVSAFVASWRGEDYLPVRLEDLRHDGDRDELMERLMQRVRFRMNNPTSSWNEKMEEIAGNLLHYGDLMMGSVHRAANTPRYSATASQVWARRIRAYARLGDAITQFFSDDGYDGDMVQAFSEAGAAGVPISCALAAYNAQADDEIALCEDCGEPAFLVDMATTNRGTACQHCVDDHYVEPEDDDGLYHIEDVYYWDSDDCYHLEREPEDEEDEEDSRSSLIHDYGENVLRYCARDRDVKSSSYGDFLMGVELEVEAEDRPEAAERFDAQLVGYAIMKYDGSLSDDEGIEIVTAPRGLAEHIKWFKEFDAGAGVRAWDAGSCGMHVHIDSRAFTALTLGKFIEFVNAPYNDEFIQRIAGRHAHWDHQCQAYCQREGDLTLGNPKAILTGKSGSRYRMVNTTNLRIDESLRLQVEHGSGSGINTVELRIFRATLNKKRLLAQIEFAHAAVMFCRVASMQHMSEGDFLVWLKPMAGVYPNLAKWFGVKQQKKLPVEPVEQPIEEEV